MGLVALVGELELAAASLVASAVADRLAEQVAGT